jgi:phage tail sheath protein FI
MAIQQSVGVVTNEIDLTTIIPTVSTTLAAAAGVFNWGPIGKAVMVSNESELIKKFGKPSDRNAETWFNTKSAMDYGTNVFVSRAANTTSVGTNGTLSAIAATSNVSNSVLLASVVKNQDDFLSKQGSFDSSVLYVAKYPSSLGNSLKIDVCDTPEVFTSNVSLSTNNVTGSLNISIGANTGSLQFDVVGNTAITVANTQATNVLASLSVGDFVEVGNTEIGKQNLKLTSISAKTQNSTTVSVEVGFETNYRLRVDTASHAFTRKWEYYPLFTSAPTSSKYQKEVANSSVVDEMHVVITDADGAFTGVPGAILETYKGLSRATDAKGIGGASIYYQTVINGQSQYVWAVNDRDGASSNTAVNLTSPSAGRISLNFAHGQDGVAEDTDELAPILAAWEIFKDTNIDISLVMAGKSIGGVNGEQIGNFIFDNITSVRKDCLGFVSPPREAVVNNIGNEKTAVMEFRDLLRDTSYGVLDSGYKYIYDKYNDVYRWVPLNGDMVGLCVRTDATRDAWWSPGGYDRGRLKNVVKLAWNPTKSERDEIYPIGINPVITERGAGTILLGDRTLQYKTSAFDRINVRRLFIVLEKAISKASKYTLFEMNDEFTRAQFKAMIKPYLKTVQDRRGITDFIIVCDSSNNSSDIIDRNEFVGDIYIKPARSINFITLNFVAVRDGVSFSTVIGQF